MTRRHTLPAGATALLALALALAACGPSRDQRLAAETAADHAHCLELGFEEGTEGYGDCRLTLREVRASEAQTRAGTGRFGVGIGIGIGL